MGVAKKSLRQVFPPGSPWRLRGNLGSLVDAIGNVLDTMKAYMHGTVTESLPGTAEDTLAEWYEALGIKHDPTKPVSARQTRAQQVWSSTGRQDKDYIESQVQRAFPDVEIQETEYTPNNMVGLGQVGRMQVTDGYPAWFSDPPEDGSFLSFDYRVVGEVDDNADLLALQNLIERIQPATHRPTYDITIRNQTATAEVGLGMTGLMEVGKTKDD